MGMPWPKEGFFLVMWVVWIGWLCLSTDNECSCSDSHSDSSLFKVSLMSSLKFFFKGDFLAETYLESS